MTRELTCLLILAALGAHGCSSSHDGSTGTGGASGSSGNKPGSSTSGATGTAGQGSGKGTSGATTGAAGSGTGSGSGSGGSGATGTGGAASGAGGASAGTGGAAGTRGSAGTGGTAGSAGAGGTTSTMAPPCDQVKALVDAYKAAHPGNGGKDWDINAKTPAEIAADPAAQQLMALCGPDQRPIIPALAWEYGGGDHPWINPDSSALVYCVYIPVNPGTDHWQHDAAMDHVLADVSIKCPDQNPCKDKQGADQVAACIGDPTNFEILVDTASLNDGADVGLTLANSSTDLNLILQDGTKVHLYTGT